jgi:hypothetical protein
MSGTAIMSIRFHTNLAVTQITSLFWLCHHKSANLNFCWQDDPISPIGTASEVTSRPDFSLLHCGNGGWDLHVFRASSSDRRNLLPKLHIGPFPPNSPDDSNAWSVAQGRNIVPVHVQHRVVTQQLREESEAGSGRLESFDG